MRIYEIKKLNEESTFSQNDDDYIKQIEEDINNAFKYLNSISFNIMNIKKNLHKGHTMSDSELLEKWSNSLAPVQRYVNRARNKIKKVRNKKK